MSDRKAPTITDVANRAGVSVGTVSNVLNGTTPVSKVKQERVALAIRELGYSQNRLAQGLRRRNAPLVGLCVPFTTTSYFSALVDAFESVASARGFEIMQVLTGLDPEKELRRVESLLRFRVGGVIILPSAAPEAAFKTLKASGTPFVVIDRPTSDGAHDQVTFDNVAAMTEASSRLIALGHRRILFVCRQRRLPITVARIETLRAVAAAASEPVEVRVLECAYEEHEFLARLGPELSGAERPTAVIVSNSAMAARTIRALRAFDLRCPEDVSLLAFDEPDWADLVQPTLSVIRQPTRAIALTAWDILMRRMSGETDGARQVELKAEIALRESVCPAAR